MVRKILFFSIAVCISLAGATYRWTDSAHSIGIIKASGGMARHPSILESGSSLYTLIATATVIPPYRGDARITLEGGPEMDYTIHSSDPVIDLGIRRHPRLKENVLYDLRPKDRIALWVVMKPPAHDLAFTKACCDGIKQEPAKYSGRENTGGRYTLAFYDTKTNRAVLSVPLIFTGRGETDNACEHHH